MSRACRQPVCLLAVHVWVDLGGEPGSGRKVVGTGVQQKLPPGRQISYLSKGGTRRTRLIGLPAIWMRLKRQGGRLSIADGLVKARAGGAGLLEGIMLYEPFINLLVVTLRAAWFNFRGWNKRR